MKILILTDTHLLFKNPKNRVDLIREGIELFYNITYNIIPNNNIDMVIHTGDLFDRGFPKIPTNEWSVLMDIMNDMHSDLDGKLFLTLGNHEYTYSRDNPTFLITEVMDNNIKEFYLSKDRPETISPIWKSPAHIDFGHTIINLMHYRPDMKYKLPNQGNKNVIGVYHDDLVSFESKQELYHHRLGKGIDVTNTDIFENVDVAVLGHIHKPLMDFILPNDRETLMMVPGSLVNRTSAEKHKFVDLPIIEITETGYKLDKVRYKLPKREDSFIEEEVERNKDLYEMSKIMKETKNLAKTSNFFNEMLAKLNNPELEILIREAHLKEEPKSVRRAKSFTKRELEQLL